MDKELCTCFVCISVVPEHYPTHLSCSTKQWNRVCLAFHIHTPSALNKFQGYAIFAKVEEGEEEGEEESAATDDHAKHYFDDFFNANEQEVTSQNEPVSETGIPGIS